MAVTKMKSATCVIAVPAMFSPTKQEIAVGEKISVVKSKFVNGEGYLILADGTKIPDIFFE